MSTFRCRALKSKSNAGKETLLSKHLDILKGFRSTKKTVITNRRHLDDLKKTLREVEEQETSPEQIARALDLRDEIRVSEGELRSLERNEDEDKYYLANSDLIFKYYETTSETPECAKPSVEGGKRSVVDFLQPETEPSLADDTPTPHKRRQQGSSGLRCRAQGEQQPREGVRRLHVECRSDARHQCGADRGGFLSAMRK